MTSVMSLFCAACKKIQLMNARMVLSLLLLPLWHGKHSMLMDGCCFVSFSTNIISQFPSKFICFIILLLNRFFYHIQNKTCFDAFVFQRTLDNQQVLYFKM